MSEPLSQTIANSFVTGLVLGIINRISKKTVTIIWIIAVVLFLTIVIFADGTSRMSQMWEVGNWIAMIITVNIAFLIGYMGADTIKDTFKKRNKQEQLKRIPDVQELLEPLRCKICGGKISIPEKGMLPQCIKCGKYNI